MPTLWSSAQIHVAVSVVVVLLLLGISSTAAQTGGTIDSLVYSGTLDDAVRAATTAQMSNTNDMTMFIAPISQREGWVFGTNGLMPVNELTNGGEYEDGHASPQILLFFAEQRPNGWTVAIEHSSAFANVLHRLPPSLLTPDQRATIQPSTQLTSGDGSMKLSLPWATGETVSLTQGPHVNISGVRSSLDFSGGSRVVRAAHKGVIYRLCPKNPNVYQDYVRIDHGDGISTNYYHLSDITVTHGSTITDRGIAIGRQGNTYNCLGGKSTAPHLHFWISRTSDGVELPMHNIDLGGWTVEAGPQRQNAKGEWYYDGCLIRISGLSRISRG